MHRLTATLNKKPNFDKARGSQTSFDHLTISISIDERVSLKQCFTNILFHCPTNTLDTSFVPPKPEKAHTR